MFDLDKYPASKETGIDHSDYVRMGTDTHFVPSGNSPRWALNDEKLRLVVVHKICNAAGRVAASSNLEDLKPLEEAYLKAIEVEAAAPGSAVMRKHLEIVKRWGGPLAFFTSLLYRRYRLGLPSPTLAAHYGMKAATVRQQIYRCCNIARALFLDPEEHLPWHFTATMKKIVLLTHNQKVFGQSRNVTGLRPPKYCAVCGKEVPPRHWKFCSRRCCARASMIKYRAKKKGQPRPVFCGADCKVKYFTPGNKEFFDAHSGAK